MSVAASHVRGEVKRSAQARPDALLDALGAVLDGHPEAAIEITNGVYVRAGYLVEAMAPAAAEAVQLSQLYVTHEAHREAVLARIKTYTGSAA